MGNKPSMGMIIRDRHGKYEIDKSILEDVVKEYASTDKAFKQICEEKGIDSYLTHMNIALDSKLNKCYTSAKKDKANVLAEQTIPIADSDDRHPQRQSNSIKSRQWLASKYDPNTFGERVQVDQRTVEINIPPPPNDVDK